MPWYEEGVFVAPLGCTTGDIWSKSRPYILLRKVDVVAGIEHFYRVHDWELVFLNDDGNPKGTHRRVCITLPQNTPSGMKKQYSDRRVFHILDSPEEVFPAVYWDPQTQFLAIPLLERSRKIGGVFYQKNGQSYLVILGLRGDDIEVSYTGIWHVYCKVLRCTKTDYMEIYEAFTLTGDEGYTSEVTDSVETESIHRSRSIKATLEPSTHVNFADTQHLVLTTVVE